MGISDWTAAEWGSFLTAAGAALVLLVKTCFSGMSESRCETIKCCCCHVSRAVKTIKDGETDAPQEEDEDRP
jgi:hypothetical protein